MKKPIQQRQRTLMQAIALTALLSILLYLGAFYLMTHQPDPSYFQTIPQKEGKPALKRMVALRAPIINKASLIHWASEAACAAYTYDQANYRTQLQEVIKTYFTESGGESFQAALDDSGVLEQLVSQQLLVTAVVENKPALLKAGMLLGNESWKVQLPLLVTYQTASQVQKYRFIVTMLIVRIPPAQDPRGIGIDKIWVRKA